VSGDRPERIDQVVHVLAGHDAIGTHVLHLRSLLRSMGFASDVYAGATQPEVADEAFPFEALPATTRPGTWLVFHHSIGTPVAEAVLRRREPMILDYHNVTPASLVRRWAPWVRAELELGREQLGALAPAARFGIAHSHFSQSELSAAGCRHSAVAAPFSDLAVAPGAFPGNTGSRGSAGQGAQWLFVGRVSPHKAQHDLLKALACYRRCFDPDARLVLVGTSLGEEYPRALDRFAARLGLTDAVERVGVVSGADLARYYATSEVFLCASDHEGFCVPLVEAMFYGLPVVAYDAAAVGETVGDGGLVLRDKAPMTLATAAHRVVSDASLRKSLVRAGRRRVEEFTVGACNTRFRAVLEEALSLSSEPPGPWRPAAAS
jgi:glycosyltransferase involved in cell wall biosynthesis